jgi:TolB-like protein/tRNA A-37 threonylcarbamoyl transferase component Bud32
MAASDLRPDQLQSATKEYTKCEKCGATLRLDTGICVSCLLREGLQGGDDVSQAFFQTVLGEVDAPNKSWFLGNYEILEQIGCGGMGVIYRARQRHSRRIVAVKRVLSYRADSHGALQRFRREAQAVASLDHPNILPIYEVSESEDGLPFFSMKFAEKGSLQENAASLRDEPRKCVQLMAKVAHAVEYAHSRGVLHRDLKPGNILLNERGEPLVSDFGLAKLLDGNNDLTRSLTTFGPAGFIAPEQAGDAAVGFTPVADVYSLGAVLFNVLAGRPPFLGSNPVSVIRQASETQAPKLRSLAPSLDRDLETICARCLERDPKARYQSAGDLAADLEHWLAGRPIVARPVSPPARLWRWSQRNPKLVGAATAGLLLGAAAVWLFRGELFHASQFNPPDRSIAVLPFTDSTGAKDQEYLCDGISEEILRTLTQVNGLRVVGRASSFSLKGKNTREVGEKLNVGNVLEGSLQRQGNRVRVTAELVDARNGFRIWTETYEREFDSAFALQDEIGRSIADALKSKFADRLSAHEQPANRVYDRYLQGLFSDVTHPLGVSAIDASMAIQNPSDAFAVPGHIYPGDFELHRPNIGVTAAPRETAFTGSARDLALAPSPRTNKITADVIAAPPEVAFHTTVHDRASEAELPMNKITGVAAVHPETALNTSLRDRASEAELRTAKTTADMTAAPPKTAPNTSVHDRAPEADFRTNKITADGPASLKGFVKDAKGEPIKGADVRIESRDGKQEFTTVKTDTQGRYISQGLQSGVYRVTLLVSGTVKASIMNTRTKENQPTELNFDFRPTSQAGNIAKSGKHIVWMPGRTGTHLGGNWVEVDDKGNEHSDSNIRTYTTHRW